MLGICFKLNIIINQSTIRDIYKIILIKTQTEQFLVNSKIY